MKSLLRLALLLLTFAPLGAWADSVIVLDGRTSSSASATRSVDVVISKPTRDNKKDYVFLSSHKTSATEDVGITSALGNSLLFDVDPVTLSQDLPLLAQSTKLSLVMYKNENGQLRRGFEFALASSYALRNTNSLYSTDQDYVIAGQDSQLYNFGLNMGYAGFQIGASYSRQMDHFSTGYSGFDLGFGYYANSWSTNIQFADYRRERDRLFGSSDLFYEQFYAMEVGAAYSLVPGVTFSGRFKYYDYDQKANQDTGPEDVQVFMLGTNVNF